MGVKLGVLPIALSFWPELGMINSVLSRLACLAQHCIGKQSMRISLCEESRTGDSNCR